VQTDGLDGIQVQFRGYVDSAPRVRFTQTGETLWEFGVRLINSWLTHTETLVVRVPDQNLSLLERWVVPGRQVLVRGTAHVARWQAKDGRERVRVVVEPVRELMPLDEHAMGSAPAALDYRDRKMPVVTAVQPRTQKERAARVRALLEETPMS
jgi:single-stranded DNA-binding protein